MVKQVIVIRKDLNMRRGKEIAQGAHASIAFLSNIVKRSLVTSWVPALSMAEMEWINTKFTKICLQVESEQELLDIQKKAIEANLVIHLITDAGLTEFDGVPTNTCLAIGPDYSEKIDPVTGHLKLY
jgi:PTH2 family peptidyl-tRNA hydrolase